MQFNASKTLILKMKKEKQKHEYTSDSVGDQEKKEA